MPGLLLLPAALAGAAAAAWAARPGGPAGRWLALGAALAAAPLAAGPVEPRDAPWLLLGARTGLDHAGRVALVAVAALLLHARRPAPAGPADAARPWLALLAAGLAAAAVAFDAGVLAAGHVAALLAAYGLAARGPGGRAGAARFMAAAVAGEVLLVDALAEYGHAAESAHLDAMRLAAGGELGPGAALLLLLAFGLPLAAAGLVRLPAPAAVIAAVGALAAARLTPAADLPALAPAGLAFLGLAGLAALGALLGWAVGSGRARPHAPPTPGGHRGAHDAVGGAPRPGEAPSLAARLAWLGAAEVRLRAEAGRGLLLLALVAGLSIALALAR